MIPRYEGLARALAGRRRARRRVARRRAARVGGARLHRRALRLRDACVAVARDGWPVTASGLRALPGSGRTRRPRWRRSPSTSRSRPSTQRTSRVSAGSAPSPRRWSRRAGGVVQPRDDGSRGDDLPARRARCAAAPWRGSAVGGRGRRAGRARRRRQRFEDTDRFARGRIVAALAAGEAVPGGLGEERTERALARARARRPRRPRRRRGSSALAGHL